MKLIVCSDFHITDKCPRARTDENYLDTCCEKVKQILEYAANNKIEYVLQAGDFFDSHRASDYIKQRVISLLLEYKNNYGVHMMVVFGQHDLRFHNSNIENTPLKVLEQAKAIHILNPDPIYLDSGNVRVYGASWNEEPNTELDSNVVNILVTHRMVIKDKLWEQQEGGTYIKNLFRQFPHDFIITGDNHQHLIYTINQKGKVRHAINCGSLLRSNITQMEHTPSFYVIDTETKDIARILLDIAPIDTVMQVEQEIENKRVNDDLMQFIEEVQKNSEQSEENVLDFIRAVQYQAERADAPIANIINNILEEVEAND